MTSAITKRCPQCDQWKLLDFFGRNRAAADGHDHYCKECRREYDRSRKRTDYWREYAREHSEERKAYARLYYAKNAEWIKSKVRAKNLAYYHEHKHDIKLRRSLNLKAQSRRSWHRM